MKDLNKTVQRLGGFWSSESLGKDLHAISVLKDNSVTLKKRVESAETLLATVLDSARVYGKSLSGLGPGNNARHRDNLGDLVDFLGILSSTYGALVEQLSDDRRKLSRQLSQHLGWALMRELACVYESAVLQSSAFSAWPDGLWTRSHRLYLTARRYGLDTQVHKKPVCAAHNMTCIEETYKCLVLLGLSDPYQLSSVDAYHIEKFLETRRDYAVITDSKSRPKEAEVLFRLDPDVDVSGSPFAQISDSADATSSVFLDTRKLVKSVRGKRQRLLRRPKESDKDFGPNVRSDLKHLFHQLELRWSGVARRRHQRIAADGDVEVLISFDAILQALTPQTHSSEMAEMFTQMQTAYAATDEPGRISPDTESLLKAISVDASTSGARLKLHDALGAKLRVGDLLLWRHSDSARGDWQIGIIRWIQQTDSSMTEIGVIRIVGKPTLGALSMRPDDSALTREMTALCVVNESSSDLLSIVYSTSEASGSPVGISVNAEPLKIEGVKEVLSTRLLRIFKLSVSEIHRGRLASSITTPRREPMRARRGQIWSATQAEDQDLS